MVGPRWKNIPSAKDASNNQFVLGGEISTYNTTNRLSWTGVWAGEYFSYCTRIIYSLFDELIRDYSPVITTTGWKTLNSYDSKAIFFPAKAFLIYSMGMFGITTSQNRCRSKQWCITRYCCHFLWSGWNRQLTTMDMPKDNTSSITGKQSTVLHMAAWAKRGWTVQNIYRFLLEQSGQQSVNGTSIQQDVRWTAGLTMNIK